MMVGLKNPSHSWWFDGHNNPRHSSWLQSTLSELDEKAKAMLKLIEEEADSFAQCVEMYYKRRPELINMVEDLYCEHRSLAEQIDKLKSESMNHPINPLQSPLLIMNPLKKSYNSFSKTYYSEEIEESDGLELEEEIHVNRAMSEEEDDSGESKVVDPEQEEEAQVGSVIKEQIVSSLVSEGESLRLREEIVKLKDENNIQKAQLQAKDEEKREVIRQLSLSLEILKENVGPKKKHIVKKSFKKWGPFEFNRLKGLFSVQLFNGSSKSQYRLVAL